MSDKNWHNAGHVDSLKEPPMREIKIGNTVIALSYFNGEFGAISGTCNHVGGPLGQGHLDGEFVVCPWHHYKFNRKDGVGEPGFEEDRVPKYELRINNNHLFINLKPKTARHKLSHPPHPLEHPLKEEMDQ